MGAGDRHHLRDRLGLGHVEGDVELGPALAVDLLKRGHVARQLVATQRGDRSPQPRPDARMDQHHDAVGGESHVALDTGGTQAARLAEGAQGVLEAATLRPAAMGEAQGQLWCRADHSGGHRGGDGGHRRNGTRSRLSVPAVRRVAAG